MSDPINITMRAREPEPAEERRDDDKPAVPTWQPSNPVYERVGDVILRAARDGVRRGMPPKDILREIREEHGVHLNTGELRLLLATRRPPEPASRTR